MSNTSERARFDAAMDYAKQAYPRFQSMFNTDNKLPNLIAAFLMLDCAVRCLGATNLQTILDEDPDMKNLIAEVQKDFPNKLKRLDAGIPGGPNNIIHVDFKKGIAV